MQGVPNDYYDGISKGTFDGAFASWAQISVYKFEEVATYFLDYGFHSGNPAGLYELENLEFSAPDIQKLIVDLTPETVATLR